MKLSDLKAKDENSPKHLNTKNISSPMNKTEISISTDQKSPIKPSDFELEIYEHVNDIRRRSESVLEKMLALPSPRKNKS